MEKFMFVLVCIVAISAMTMIMLVIFAVLKVASEKDDDYELTERIKFQTREGLIRRDDENSVRMERCEPHTGGMEQDSRDTKGDAVLKNSQVPVGCRKGADNTTAEEPRQVGIRREVCSQAEEKERDSAV